MCKFCMKNVRFDKNLGQSFDFGQSYEVKNSGSSDVVSFCEHIYEFARYRSLNNENKTWNQNYENNEDVDANSRVCLNSKRRRRTRSIYPKY